MLCPSCKNVSNFHTKKETINKDIAIIRCATCDAEFEYDYKTNEIIKAI